MGSSKIIELLVTFEKPLWFLSNNSNVRDVPAPSLLLDQKLGTLASGFPQNPKSSPKPEETLPTSDFCPHALAPALGRETEAASHRD